PQRSGVSTHGRRDRSRVVRSVTRRVLKKHGEFVTAAGLYRALKGRRFSARIHTQDDEGALSHQLAKTRVLIAALLAASPLTAQQLAFTPYHANGTYAVRERIGWHVSVVPGQSAARTYTYTVKRDGLSVIATGTLDLTTGGATIETSLARPGMVLVEVRPPAGTP